MTSYRLTKYDRNNIARNATNDTFLNKISEKKKELKDLSDKIYVSLFGKDLIDKVNAIPSEWLHKDYYVSIRLYNGYQMEVNFFVLTPMPNNVGRYTCDNTKPLLKDRDLGDQLMKLDEEIKELQAESNNAEIKLKSLLNSVTTLKQLKEIWPAGEVYYSHLIPTSKKYVNNLPTILVEDINKIFSLPKEDLAA